jgi:enamine deaminase RidA (YjgF/YER057c/UK114 family)
VPRDQDFRSLQASSSALRSPARSRSTRWCCPSIREQTRQALRNLELCLEAAGCGLGDVLKVTAFLADLNDRSGYNEVYAGAFEPPYPARTTVQAGLPDGLLVEIEAIVCRPISNGSR